MANLPEGRSAEPVEIYSGASPLVVDREGEGFLASCAIAVADATAADAAIYSMRLSLGGDSAYIKALYGTLIFNGTATATGKNGIYFEKFAGGPHSSGTAISIVARDDVASSAVYDCRFHTGALTASTAPALSYSGAKFGRSTIPISASGVAVPFYVPFGAKGLKLAPGQGLAMRLTYQAVVGLFVDLNALWVEA